MTTEDRKPWWLYPNLLSLDAPLVALIWLHIFAQTWRLGYHPTAAYVTLVLAVWAIYVGDRLLDVSLFSASPEKLAPRHRFHQRHRKLLTGAVIIVLLSAVLLVVTGMPMTIYRYLLPGAVMVAGFFGYSMISSQETEDVPHMKNIVAGITFAFGVCMTAHLYRFEVGVMDMLKSREFMSFAVLCIINIAAIDLWEHSRRSSDIEVKASDELTLTLPLVLLSFASVFFATQDIHSRPFYYAILTAVALLYVLNRTRSKFSIDALRVLADLALMAPILVFEAASMS